MTEPHPTLATRKMPAMTAAARSGVAAALLLVLALPASSRAGDTPAAGRYASDVVTLFATACLRHYPDPSDFGRWVHQDGIKPLPDATAHALTRDPQGRTYSVALDGTRVIVAARHDNLCTLYVRRVDTRAARRALASLRGGLTESGQLTERRPRHRRHAAGGDLDTTDYTYVRGDGRVILQLTVSTSTSTRGFYQLAMSASMATRHTPADRAAPAPSGNGGG